MKGNLKQSLHGWCGVYFNPTSSWTNLLNQNFTGHPKLSRSSLKAISILSIIFFEVVSKHNFEGVNSQLKDAARKNKYTVGFHQQYMGHLLKKNNNH